MPPPPAPSARPSSSPTFALAEFDLLAAGDLHAALRNLYNHLLGQLHHCLRNAQGYIEASLSSSCWAHPRWQAEQHQVTDGALDQGSGVRPGGLPDGEAAVRVP